MSNFVPYNELMFNAGPRVYINITHSKMHVQGESPLEIGEFVRILADKDDPNIIAFQSVKQNEVGEKHNKISSRIKNKPEKGVSFQIPKKFLEFISFESNSENLYSKIMEIDGIESLVIDLRKRLPINRRDEEDDILTCVK